MRGRVGGVALLLAGCAGAATSPVPQRYEGWFTRGFEVEAFRPCGQNEDWWVTEGAELRARYAEVATADYQPVFVVVRGEVGPPGRYGHLGIYEREIAVTEVLEVSAARQEDCE